jgi:hypothetical protein
MWQSLDWYVIVLLARIFDEAKYHRFFAHCPSALVFFQGADLELRSSADQCQNINNCSTPCCDREMVYFQVPASDR